MSIARGRKKKDNVGIKNSYYDKSRKKVNGKSNKTTYSSKKPNLTQPRRLSSQSKRQLQWLA